MIEMEGHVLPGLDEFMLRAGHLCVLCRVAHEVGGSWSRINREAAERFSTEVDVRSEENACVARYLREKSLCVDSTKGIARANTAKEFRYTELETYIDAVGELRVRNAMGGVVRVTWQDRCLAAPGVSSRVGAITYSGKFGSKTGLSHVCDWAQFLELIDSTGQLTPMGRLLVTIDDAVKVPFVEWNPYVRGPARIVFSYAYLQKDIDLIARFAPLCLDGNQPLGKSTCRDLFVRALETAVTDSDSSKSISSRMRFELFQQWRDLERAATKAGVDVDKTSTAWHRVASRVESLTDIGLFEKGRGGDAERYQYTYYATSGLEYTVRTLNVSSTGQDWLEDHLVHAVLSPNPETRDAVMADSELLSGLRSIVVSLALPTTLFPLDCLSLGLACLNHTRGKHVPIGVLRRQLEGLALSHADFARLARGREGSRAEYLSLNVGGLENG